VPRTRVKICSICRVDDARLAADAGADAIGLILHPPAKRYVPPDLARDIVRALPPFVTPVGVFVDAPAAHMRELARHIGLTHLQLHGSEPEDLIASLPDFTLVKAVKVYPATFPADLARWDAVATRHPQLRAVLLETPTQEAGGTGVENDWRTIRAAIQHHPPRLSIIAAGGLRPDTVAAVVQSLRPHAVDVSSGVEESVGKKSPQKVRDFVDAVAHAN
jgi:phosphoribosylanthranilate isomerase